LESKVVVENKGSTFIKDLVVGDMVLSDEKGTYTKYYSTGHFDGTKLTNFLRIYTELNIKPLELTPGHMVYTASSKLPVPAYSIKVGDVLKTIDGPSKVTFVDKISRKGLVNPLTLSGSIVVEASYLPFIARSPDLKAMMLAGSILLASGLPIGIPWCISSTLPTASSVEDS
jgi:hypothetical protein